VPIETNIRHFLKDALEARIHESWLSSYNMSYVAPIQHLVDWQFTFECLFHNIDDALPTSRQHSSSVLFKLQNLNRALPTLEWLKLRQPHIYSASWFCCLCNTQKETWHHIYSCFKNAQSVLDIRDRFFKRICDQTDDLAPLTVYSTWQIMSASSSFSFNNAPSDQFSFIHLINSLVPLSITTTMAAQGLSQSQIKDILLPAMFALSKDLYNLIWKPRCDITIQRQLSMGLSQRSKKIKYRNRPTSSIVPPSSQRVPRASSLDKWSSWVHNSLVFGTNWLNFQGLLEYIQFPIVLFR